MFNAILRTQWKWMRLIVFLASVVAFALPVLSLRVARQTTDPKAFIGYMQSWSTVYALAAGVLGLALAVFTWSHDHRGRHVYALSLPIARWRYVLMRFGAGALFAAIPAAALAAGAVLVSPSDAIPVGLHAYPIALAMRFLFAALVAYALFFSISSATAKTAGYILGAIALFVVILMVSGAAGMKGDVASPVLRAVFVDSGMLGVFTGRWMLIDA
jgi:hypothetical protein